MQRRLLLASVTPCLFLFGQGPPLDQLRPGEEDEAEGIATNAVSFKKLFTFRGVRRRIPCERVSTTNMSSGGIHTNKIDLYVQCSG